MIGLWAPLLEDLSDVSFPRSGLETRRFRPKISIGGLNCERCLSPKRPGPHTKTPLQMTIARVGTATTSCLSSRLGLARASYCKQKTSAHGNCYNRRNEGPRAKRTGPEEPSRWAHILPANGLSLSPLRDEKCTGLAAKLASSFQALRRCDRTERAPCDRSVSVARSREEPPPPQTFPLTAGRTTPQYDGASFPSSLGASFITTGSSSGAL